jgi:hypothetical protein
MMKVARLCVCAALCGIAAVAISAQQLTPTWVQLGDGGAVIAKVVVATDGNCPSIHIDGASRAMTERRPIPNGFRSLCEAAIPRNARSARVNGQALALPKPNPSKVIVFGDTGCRLKGSEIQACNDPAKWPFEQVADDAASEKANLMIHVGDYLYREIPCPTGSEAKCGGTPEGDNWDAWKIDFFTPAAKLLTAVPWAFARGNHESCNRSWRGWFYYLDPRPWTGACERFSPSYVIKLGSFELAVFDSSETSEDAVDEKQVSIFAAQLSDLHVTNAWLVAHHPFWGFKSGIGGKPSAPLSAPLQEAWKRAAPMGVNLILSGHIHLFELILYDNQRPTQLVAGGGGTNLALPIAASLNGTTVRGSTVVAGQTQHQFGYTVLDRLGTTWRLTLKNQNRDVLLSCSLFGSAHEKSADGSNNSGRASNCNNDQ